MHSGAGCKHCPVQLVRGQVDEYKEGREGSAHEEIGRHSPRVVSSREEGNEVCRQMGDSGGPSLVKTEFCLT